MRKKKKAKTKAIAVRKKTALKQASMFDPEIVAVIRQSIAPDLTDAELKVYLGVCARYKADPIMKDIVPIIFNTKKGRILNFIISKNFCLKVAHKDDRLNGLTSKIIRNAKGSITGATATCYKKGCDKPYEVEVDFKEYYNAKNEVWGTHPGAMIQKTAKVLVLKEAFGIDMVSDIELEKRGGSMVHSMNVNLPKTKTRFVVSDTGEVKPRKVLKQKNKKEEDVVL